MRLPLIESSLLQRLPSAGRLYLYCALIGLIAGLGALFFDVLTQLGQHLFLDSLAGYRPEGPAGEIERFAASTTPFRPWALPLVSGLGGLLAGLVVFRFAPEAKGHGTDAAIDAYHQRSGVIRSRVPIAKIVASTLTLGSGGSGGREGPIAQIGAGFGSWLAGRLGLKEAHRRVMLAAGMGAGVGSIFRAPLAGALFAAEILYSTPEFESTVLIPAAIAAIIGYCVYSLATGPEPLFETAAFSFDDPRELVAYALLAVVLALLGRIYVSSFYGLERAFERLPGARILRPTLGGLLTGLVALGLFSWVGDGRVLNTLGFGYGILQDALGAKGNLEAEQGLILVLVLVSLGKILTTGLTIGSGGSAGVFGPSMVIGGSMGGAVGLVLHGMWPEVVTSPGAYVLVGMAGFFAGVANTPISTIVMVSEMTGSYGLLVPTMWVCTLSFLLGRGSSIYQSQVPSKIHSPAHQGDFRVDLLRGLRVRDLLSHDRPLRSFRESTHLSEILLAVSDTRQDFFPILKDGRRYVGGFTIHTLKQIIQSGQDLGDLVLATDLIDNGVPGVLPEDTAGTALERLTEAEVDEIPVLTAGDEPELVGLLSRRDILLAYHSRTPRS